MRTIFFALVLSIVILSSCKKDKDNDTSKNKLYPVSFHVAGFTQIIEPAEKIDQIKLSALTTSSLSELAVLVYKVYDATGTLKNTIKQHKGSPVFGTFNDILPIGNYTIVIVGGNNSFEDKGEYFKGAASYYKKMPISVTSSPLNQDLILSRINGELQVIIEDNIPFGIESISVSVLDYEGYSFLNDAPYGANNTTRRYFSTSISGSPEGHTFMPYPLLNTITPITVILEADNNDYQLVVKKTIANVLIKKNTKTILRGRLFTNNVDGSGFKINFDTTLSSDTIKINF